VVAARQRNLLDAEHARVAGTALATDAARARASALEAEYARVAALNEVEDLEVELSEIVGIEAGTSLDLVAPDSAPEALRPLEEYLARALRASPEVASARIGVVQARRAVSLARADYIPETGIGITYTYQDGVPFLPKRSAAFAIQGSWTIWDFGKRSATLREREAAVDQAKLAVERAEDQVVVAVEKAYRKAQRARIAAAAARAALEARRDASRVATDREKQGLVLAAFRRDAEAMETGSAAELESALLEEWIARAELDRVVGRS
jgi:outer membrane protein TolC